MSLTQDEAEYVLQGIITREQQRLQALLTPYIQELTLIGLRKPARPIQMPDGTFAVYTGPSSDEIAGPYRAPSWLVSMCDTVGEQSADLRRYRERFAERTYYDGNDQNND